MLEVIEAGDLAGRMPLERERQLVGRDAAAIVADRDERDAALLGRDLDAARTGVEGVLDQFLGEGCGAFDDLAGGDLVDEVGRQQADRHAWEPQAA